MFVTSNLNTDDPHELARFLYIDYDASKDKLPKNYTLGQPYRLVFSNINLNEYDNYYSLSYVGPAGTLYTQMTKDETDSIFTKLVLHKHDYFEFMFVLSGEIYVNIENERHLYKKGSCYILNKNVMHTEEYSTDFQIVFLQISTEIMKALYFELSLNFFDVEKTAPLSAMREFIAKNLTSDTDTHKSYVDFIPTSEDMTVANTLHDFFDQITRETLSPSVGSTVNVMNFLKKLFLYMSKPNIFCTTPFQIGSDAEYVLYGEIVTAMEESDGRISRSQLAEKLNYSGSYLNEICKKYSGLSLFDYGMTFCMKKAANLLLSTTDNITDIGYALGFTNRSHFYKIFKEHFEMTPAEYRRNKAR